MTTLVHVKERKDVELADQPLNDCVPELKFFLRVGRQVISVRPHYARKKKETRISKRGVEMGTHLARSGKLNI